jgi:hypothetical protein
VATLDDSMVRRVIRKPFDIQAVAEALIETAKQLVAEQKIDVVTFDPAEVIEPQGKPVDEAE